MEKELKKEDHAALPLLVPFPSAALLMVVLKSCSVCLVNQTAGYALKPAELNRKNIWCVSDQPPLGFVFGGLYVDAVLAASTAEPNENTPTLLSISSELLEVS